MSSLKLKKIRADDLVLRNGIADTKNKAQALIMTAKVEYLDKNKKWNLVEKSGQQISPDTEIKLIGAIDNDVSRGAKKIRGAFDYWNPLKAKVSGAKCLDIGSSTGGFTQVLLELGASSVACVDVGTHQLHEKIRSNKKVSVFEKQHVLKIDNDFWTENNVKIPFSVIVTDLSFISVTKTLEKASAWLADGGIWVVLVKPQFELDSSKAPKGIVKDDNHRQEALQKVVRCVEMIEGLSVKDSMDCPVAGAKGNREYFIWVEKHLF